MSRIDMTIVAGVVFWHKKIHPIIFSDIFYEWIKYSSARIIAERGETTPHNFSEISYSVLDRGGHVNPSRFYIGFFSSHPDEQRVFCQYFSKIIDTKDLDIEHEVFACDPPPHGFGLGVDMLCREKRAYLAFPDAPRLIGWTFDWSGMLCETKHYVRPRADCTMATGERGERQQVDYHAHGQEAHAIIRDLELSPQARRLASSVIEYGYWLDTVSFSPTRGTALYFE